jgi:hypothetical protein
MSCALALCVALQRLRAALDRKRQDIRRLSRISKLFVIFLTGSGTYPPTPRARAGGGVDPAGLSSHLARHEARPTPAAVRAVRSRLIDAVARTDDRAAVGLAVTAFLLALSQPFASLLLPQLVVVREAKSLR